jgi:predicted component of type VI protein secretion system
MSAVLIPISGGAAIPLRKSRVYLGRAPGTDKSLPPSADTALCLLELADGWWYIEDLRAPGGIKVNSKSRKREKLVPHDEIEVGKHRFRIEFEAPKHTFGRTSSGGFQVVTPKPASKPNVPPPHITPAPAAAVATQATPRPTGSIARRPAGLLGRLVPLGGGEDHPLLRPKLVVGRSFECDVVIREKTVSGRHCELVFENSFWRVRDLGSRNGTRVGGRRCLEAWVKPNTRLTLGTESFRIDYVADGELQDEEIITGSLSGSLAKAAGISRSMMDEIARKYEDEQDDSKRNRFDLSKDL